MDRIYVDEVSAAWFRDPTSDAGSALKTIGFPGLRIVATIVAPHALSVDVQVAELHSIVADLHSIIDDLHGALDSSATEHYAKLITTQINGILAFAATIA